MRGCFFSRKDGISNELAMAETVESDKGASHQGHAVSNGVWGHQKHLVAGWFGKWFRS
jgi:hypothetical protein